MRRTLEVAAMLLMTTMFSVEASSEMYKCVKEGKTEFSDRPCESHGATQEVYKVDPPPESQKKPRVVYLDGHTSEEEAQDKLYEKDPRDIRSAAEEAKEKSDRRMKNEEWKRRNMSVGCITNKYNAWVGSQSKKPTKEESDRKVGEFRRECREMLRLPEDLPEIARPTNQDSP